MKKIVILGYATRCRWFPKHLQMIKSQDEFEMTYQTILKGYFIKYLKGTSSQFEIQALARAISEPEIYKMLQDLRLKYEQEERKELPMAEWKEKLLELKGISESQKDPNDKETPRWFTFLFGILALIGLAVLLYTMWSEISNFMNVE